MTNVNDLNNFYTELADYVAANDPEHDAWQSFPRGRRLILMSENLSRVVFIDFNGEDDGALWFSVDPYFMSEGKSFHFDIDVDSLCGTAGKVGLWCL